MEAATIARGTTGGCAAETGYSSVSSTIRPSPASVRRRTPASRAFYDRKLAECKRHTQALIALARRRVDVLWAMIRDKKRFENLPSRLDIVIGMPFIHEKRAEKEQEIRLLRGLD